MKRKKEVIIKKVLIVAGGTGGHIFPALSVAKKLKEMGKDVVFVSGKRKIEEEIFKKEPYKVYRIDARGFIGKSVSAKIYSLFKMVTSFINAFKILRKERPDCVFSTGGYISLPVVMAAWMMKKPVFMHEQNLRPGVANLLLSRFASRVFISFKGGQSFFPKNKVVFSGNPVREEFYDVETKRKNKTHLGLLILGGSQGARVINELALYIIPELLKMLPELKVIHQTGPAFFEEVKKGYKEKLGKRELKRLEVYPFIRNMAWAYSQVDFVISRAGATTIAELTVTRTPALLIPFPYATHNHQEKNAEYLSKRGCAILIRENELKFDKILEDLLFLFRNPDKLKEMKKGFPERGNLRPEEIIIKEMEEVVNA